MGSSLRLSFAYAKNHPLLIIRSDTLDALDALDPRRMVELDPRLWPDVASTTPATIMVHGMPLTLPERGTPMSVPPGLWKTGRKAITQKKGGDGRRVRCALSGAD